MLTIFGIYALYALGKSEFYQMLAFVAAFTLVGLASI